MQVLPAVLHVDANATGAGTGASWADAFPLLQDALDTARGTTTPTTILVAEGVYYTDEGTNQSNDDPATSFELFPNLVLDGGWYLDGGATWTDGGREHPSVLSGDFRQVDNNVDGNFIAETVADNIGGGSNNVVNASPADSTSSLSDFFITGGYAHGSSDRHFGAGMLSVDGPIKVDRCTFSGNTTKTGPLYLRGACPSFTDCNFSGNFGRDEGGAVFASVTTGLSFSRCVFAGNDCHFGAGGGIYTDQGDTSCENCLIAGNRSQTGGGIFVEDGSVDLSYCTLTGNWGMRQNSLNDVDAGGGIYLSSSSALSASNTLIWGNAESASAASTGASVGLRALSNPMLSFDSCLVENWDLTTPGLALDGTDPASDPLLLERIDPFTTPHLPADLSRLSPGEASSVIDLGLAPSTATADVEGNLRSIDSDGDGVIASEIGAFELAVAAAPINPVAPLTYPPNSPDQIGVDTTPPPSPKGFARRRRPP